MAKELKMKVIRSSTVSSLKFSWENGRIAMFECPDRYALKANEPSRKRQFILDFQTWEDMGKPEWITVHITPKYVYSREEVV